MYDEALIAVVLAGLEFDLSVKATCIGVAAKSGVVAASGRASSGVSAFIPSLRPAVKP